MTTLYQDKYCHMEFDEEKGIHYHVMYNTTEEMDENEFKNMLKSWLRTTINVNAKKAIVFSKDLLFHITPSVQEWIVQDIDTKTPVVRTAYIMPEEFVANLGMEQYLDEAKSADMQYFSNVFNAEIWLLSD